MEEGSTVGESVNVPSDRLVAAFFLVVGVATAAAAAYYYLVFLGLEDPVTHALPSSVDYFSYVRYYYQTGANYRFLWKLSAVAFGISCFALLFRSLADLPGLGRCAMRTRYCVAGLGGSRRRPWSSPWCCSRRASSSTGA